MLSGILSTGRCTNNHISTPPANPPWGWRCPGLGSTPHSPRDKKFSGDVKSMNDRSSHINTSSVSLIQSEHSACGWQEACGQNRGGKLFICWRPHTSPSLCPHSPGGRTSWTRVPAGGFLLMLLLDLQMVTISMSSLAHA